MLLDLGAAFDTVDQAKLLKILSNEIGENGVTVCFLIMVFFVFERKDTKS